MLALWVENVVSAQNMTQGCNLHIPREVSEHMEPDGELLRITIVMSIHYVRDVPDSGGSFGVVFRWVLLCSTTMIASENFKSEKHFSMIVKWKDERYIQENKARETECQSNHVIWTRTSQFWIPTFYVLSALELVSPHQFDK